MKIVHLSDTHLGYAGVGSQRLVEDPSRPGIPIRQQEADILRGFRLAIDRILQDIHPAVVVHSGDLFDHAHPVPYAIDFAMHQVRRLGDAGIPFVIVEGDHSCPRIPGQGQVLRLLQHLPDVHVVCGQYAPVRLAGVVIHGVPHRAVAAGYTLERDRLDEECFNVLLTHAVADGYPYYNTSRRAAAFPIREIAGWFDYIALGHSHRFSQVTGTNRAFYAGTTAMVAPGDFAPNYRFGFNVVTLGGRVPEVRREEIETRPMHVYGLHDARGQSAREVLRFLERQVAAVSPRESYCSVVIEGLEPHTRRDLPIREVEGFFADPAALTLQMHVRDLTQEEAAAASRESSPQARFARLVQGCEGDVSFIAAVSALGADLLNEAQAQLNSEDVDGGE